MFGFEEKIVSRFVRYRGPEVKCLRQLPGDGQRWIFGRNFRVKSGRQGRAGGSQAFCEVSKPGEFYRIGLSAQNQEHDSQYRRRSDWLSESSSHTIDNESSQGSQPFHSLFIRGSSRCIGRTAVLLMQLECALNICQQSSSGSKCFSGL